MMTITDLVVCALAVWQAVEVWHHSELMATWRAKMEVRDGFVAAVAKCPYCLSVWVGFAAAFLVMVTPPAVPEWHAIGQGATMIVLVLALVLFWYGLFRGLNPTAKIAMNLFEGRGARTAAGTVAVAVIIAFWVAGVVGHAYAWRTLDRDAGWFGVWFWAIMPAKLFVWGLAVSRLANLGNDLTRKWCRTPRDFQGEGPGEAMPPVPVKLYLAGQGIEVRVTHIDEPTPYEPRGGQKHEPGDETGIRHGGG